MPPSKTLPFLAADGSLVMTTTGRTVALASNDNWASARIVATAPQGAASTVARAGDAMYVVYPHFGDQNPPTVERVNFVNE